MPELAREVDGVEGGRFILLDSCFLFFVLSTQKRIKESFSSLVNHLVVFTVAQKLFVVLWGKGNHL